MKKDLILVVQIVTYFVLLLFVVPALLTLGFLYTAKLIGYLII